MGVTFWNRDAKVSKTTIKFLDDQFNSDINDKISLKKLEQTLPPYEYAITLQLTKAICLQIQLENINSSVAQDP